MRQEASQDLKETGMKRKIAALIAIAAASTVALTACGSAGADNYDYYDEVQQAEIDSGSWESEAYIEDLKQEASQDLLEESCIDNNYDEFYSEYDLYEYCSEYALDDWYDHNEPDYYEPDYDYYEPDYYEPDYDYGW